VGKKHNIRVNSIQPGAGDTDLFTHIKEQRYRDQMEGLREQMSFLSGNDIAHTVLFALQAPAHVNVAEQLVLRTDQPC
jgi:NADP-dependent 3-hydroxy acid dehydrogenase YdfG